MFHLMSVTLDHAYQAIDNPMVTEPEPPEPKLVGKCAACGLPFHSGDEGLRPGEEDVTVKLGTIVRLPDGREGTICWNHLDGSGGVWGRQDFSQVEPGFSDDLPLPEFMLREKEVEPLLRKHSHRPDLECVGTEFEIVGTPDIPRSARTTDVVFAEVEGTPDLIFVEVENEERQSISVGEWVKRDDGYWVLRLQICLDGD